MSLNILLDMNISPAWVPLLQKEGWQTVHWSNIGSPSAKDREIMTWAAEHGHTIITHDLDFGTILALAHSNGPSVMQIRAQDMLLESLASLVVVALRKHEADFLAGALVVLDGGKSRARILPIG